MREQTYLDNEKILAGVEQNHLEPTFKIEFALSLGWFRLLSHLKVQHREWQRKKKRLTACITGNDK
jgi:hypothetical protein